MGIVTPSQRTIESGNRQRRDGARCIPETSSKSRTDAPQDDWRFATDEWRACSAVRRLPAALPAAEEARWDRNDRPRCTIPVSPSRGERLGRGCVARVAASFRARGWYAPMGTVGARTGAIGCGPRSLSQTLTCPVNPSYPAISVRFHHPVKIDD